MDRLTAEYKVILALRTEISELKTTPGSIVGALQEVKARAVETKGNVRKAQGNVGVSDSQRTMLIDKFASLTEELSSIPVQRTNRKADSYEITALVQRKKDGVGKLLSNVSIEV